MNGPMKNYPAIREEIDKAPGVVASTPFIYTEAMMRSQQWCHRRYYPRHGYPKLAQSD